MIESEALAKLSDLVAATVFPALSPVQLARLIRESRRIDSYGRLPSDDTEWAPGTEYLVDDALVPISRNGRVYRVTASDGLSGAVEPVWPVVDGGVVTLDGVEYTETTATLSVWDGAWDLNRAAAEGWRIKAGLVSNRHSFGSNAGNYNPEQIMKHCMEMADHYAHKGVSAVVLSSGRWDGVGRINAAHLDDAT